jgi:hypothetical protein
MILCEDNAMVHPKNIRVRHILLNVYAVGLASGFAK